MIIGGFRGIYPLCKILFLQPDKVRMYDEEIMMNDDNLESKLLTSSLLKTSGLHAGTS